MIKSYRCPNCGEFDVDRKLSEGELQECPTCSSEVKRVWTPTPSIWKTDGAFGKSKQDSSSSSN